MVNAGQKFLAGLGVLLLSFVLSVNSHAQDSYPDTIEIDILTELYEGVVFDHGTHVLMTEGCGACHHHTTGTPVLNTYCARCHAGSAELDTVSCRDCHTKDRTTATSMRREKLDYPFHDDMPDLKAAYHLSCLGCHQEVGAPVGCVDCHAKTEAGDKFYRSGEFAPKQSSGSGH